LSEPLDDLRLELERVDAGELLGRRLHLAAPEGRQMQPRERSGRASSSGERKP
jgi:hypothetical protein